MLTFHLIISKIIHETADTVTLELQNSETGPVEYEAGQFLTIIVSINGREYRRSYSFSSTPGIDSTLSITVRRIANGVVSRFLAENVQVGDKLEALKPAGRFTISTQSTLERVVFFIAAGSGIVPVFSLIKKILATEINSRIILILQNKNEEAVIFRKELLRLKKEYDPQFEWINFFSRPNYSGYPPQHLTNEILETLVLSKSLPEVPVLFYICGPSPFMRMAGFTLKRLGYRDDQIRKEIFDVAVHVPPPPLTDNNEKEIIIHFGSKTTIIHASYPQTILQAALDNNLSLPFSCRAGVCSTCVARCLQGKIMMSNNEVLTPKDTDEGLVLTCVGYALTDVEISL